MATSLVVGASGQVGGALVESLGADRAVGTSRTPPPGGVALDLGAVADRPELADAPFGRGTFDAVYLAAAWTDVESCEAREDEAMRLNRDAPAAIARAAAEHGARTVFFSTEYVFDGTSGPYAEDDATRPLSAYGRSKLAGEEAVLAADPRALVLRTTVVYGPEERGRNFAYRVASELGRGARLRVPSDQTSNPTYVRDLAAAAVALVRGGHRGVVHVAGPEVMDRASFARRLARAAGLDAERVEDATTAELGQRAPRPLRAGLRVDRLRALLPEVRLRTVEEAVAHWVRNPRGKPWPTTR